jgi:hypothetical protein
MAAADYPLPELVKPDEETNITQTMYRFEWEWNGAALADEHAFEVRIWKEGEPHYGAFDVRETAKYLEQAGNSYALPISVPSAYSVQQNGNGTYFWSVAIVNLNPYELITEATPQDFLINVLGGGGGGGGNYGGGGGGGY